MVLPSKTKVGDDADFSDLQFMIFTDYKQTANAETKRKVRSHVQSRIQRDVRNQKSKEKKGEIALNISALSQSGGNPSQPPADSKTWSLVTRAPMRLGAGRSDPFKSYPIEMDVRTHELFDHLHGKTCPMFKTLDKIGFFKTVSDDAAFRQILSTASAHMNVLRQGDDNVEASALSSTALKSVNRRIADPVQGTSDGVLVTILAFACHAVMFNDFRGTLAHFNGLEEVIRRRGGLQALKLDPVRRTVIFWIDVHTSFLHDRTPRFPVPLNLLPRFDTAPYSWGSTSAQPLLDACVTENMAEAMDELLALNQFITSELMIRDLWEDSIFAGLYVVPLLAKLLSVRYDHGEYDLSLQKQEICRISALLYISAIRRGFGVKLSPAVYIPKLIEATNIQENLRSDLVDPVLCWALFIGGIQSILHMEHQWFVSAIAEIAVGQNWSNWGELMAFVREILWIEGILHDECHEFRIEVSAEIRSSYGRLFS